MNTSKSKTRNEKAVSVSADKADKPLKFTTKADDVPGNVHCESEREGQFAELFGFQDDDNAKIILNDLTAACGANGNIPSEKNVGLLNEASEILTSIKPKDALEGLLAVQIIATHKAAMECFRQATVTNYPPNYQEKINLAVKLTRAFTTQMDALSKYRNKGKQKITVEHVEVKDGGQAIVGNVENRGRGNG